MEWISSRCDTAIRAQSTRTLSLAPWLGAQPAIVIACA